MNPSQPKILIAEDEIPLARALQLKFVSAGFAVEVAVDGEKTMEALEKGGFDVLLLDLVMPNKDGFVVLAELRQKQSKLPVVVLTNLSQEEDLKKAKELGAVDFWVKSDISLAEVIDKVKKLVGS